MRRTREENALSRSRRKLAVLAVVGIVGVPLSVVATAFACANLAALKLDHAGATPGTKVAFKGRNFNNNAAASAVQLRWNSRAGEILGEARAGAGGKINGILTVPQARPGWYIIVATQTGPNGRIASGTPGRAPLKIRAAASSAAVGAPVAPGGGPVAPQPWLIGAGLLGVALLAGISTIAVRRRPVRSALTARP
jgi:hypothetical protein